jgi:hypothetical protein
MEPRSGGPEPEAGAGMPVERSLGVRMTRLRDAQGIGTATSRCPAVGPWIRGDAERTEWPPALNPRFALASEDVPGLPETRETLDAPEAEAGG